MWILFRLVLAVIGFFAQRRSRRQELEPSHTFEGVPYWQSVRRKKGKITHFALGMPRRSPTWLSLHRESAVDRWFKRVGFSEEMQTLDPRFDDLVYVTSDYPFIGKTFPWYRQIRLENEAWEASL